MKAREERIKVFLEVRWSQVESGGVRWSQVGERTQTDTDL